MNCTILLCLRSDHITLDVAIIKDRPETMQNYDKMDITHPPTEFLK